MPGLHAKKSPSKAKLLHECSGFLTLADSLPPEMRASSGEASKLGTCTHFLLENALGSQKPPSHWAGRLIQIINEGTDKEECVFLSPRAKFPRGAMSANTFEVDAEMIANADLAYDYVESRCEELGVSMASLHLETKTNPCPEREDTPGTADVTLDAWPIVLELVDYKNGRIVVEHEDNPQVMAYLAGKAHDLGWDYAEYKLTIVQPNGRHEEGKVRSVTVPKEKLLAFVEKHRAAAIRADEAADAWEGSPDNFVETEKPDPETWAERFLKAGPHCLDSFCEAAHGNTCPAFRAYKQRQAREAEWDEPPGEPDPKAVLVATAEDAADILARAPFMNQLIRQAHRLLVGEARAGRIHPAVKFVRKRSYSRWKDDEGKKDLPPEVAEEVAQAMVEQGFIGPNEKARLFKPATIITGPQAKALVPSKKRAEFAAAFLHKPEGGLKLVPVTAPGEAVPYHPGDDFEDEAEEGDDL